MESVGGVMRHEGGGGRSLRLVVLAADAMSGGRGWALVDGSTWPF